MEVRKAVNVGIGPTFTNHLMNDHISAPHCLKLRHLTVKVKENGRTTSPVHRSLLMLRHLTLKKKENERMTTPKNKLKMV